MEAFVVFLIIVGVAISCVVKVRKWYYRTFSKDSQMQRVIEIVQEELRRGKISEKEANEKLERARKSIYKL